MPQIYWTASIYKRLTIAVTPSIGMLAEGVISNSAFTVAVTPEILMSVPERTTSVGIGVTPSVGMTAQGVSSAGLTIAITPSIGMAGQGISAIPEATFGISVTPSVSFTGIFTPNGFPEAFPFALG